MKKSGDEIFFFYFREGKKFILKLVLRIKINVEKKSLIEKNCGKKKTRRGRRGQQTLQRLNPLLKKKKKKKACDIRHLTPDTHDI